MCVEFDCILGYVQTSAKSKENLERINRLINSQESKNEKEKDEVLLAQLVAKRQEVQEEIDYLLHKIYVD